MLNKIFEQGRLVSDPTLRRTGNGVAVTSFTIAVEDDFKDKDGNKKTIFIDCVAWRQTGEFVSKHFTQGRMIMVVGKLDIRDWTDKDGNKRKSTEIVVDNAYFCDSKNSNASGDSYTAPAAFPEFPVIDGDDDAALPF